MTILLGVTILAFLAYTLVSEARHRSERQELTQRIQAPQMAVAQVAAQDQPEGEPFISPNDDVGFTQYKLGMTGSDS